MSHVSLAYVPFLEPDAPPPPPLPEVSGRKIAPWSDEEMLRALELRRTGHSQSEVSLALGRTRSAVAGLFARIDDDCREADSGWRW